MKTGVDSSTEMMDPRRELYSISVAERQETPIWELVDEDLEIDGVLVVPVRQSPVDDLAGRLIATQVRLACGDSLWAWVGNVNLTDPFISEQLMSVSIEKDSTWFHLARYFDVEIENFGPPALATFLGRSITEVFPIAIDISQLAVGDPSVLQMSISSEPSVRLSDGEVLELVFRS